MFTVGEFATLARVSKPPCQSEVGTVCALSSATMMR